MVANNKEDFLFQLHNELHRIGIDADEEIFSDFEEHFKESSDEGLSEEETCRRLGDVKEIARSYISIESTRINSIVAQAIEQNRPHVSLTKPGRDVPADLSLAKGTASEDTSEAFDTPIREYTPTHLSEEIYPEAARSTPKIDIGNTSSDSGQSIRKEAAAPMGEAAPKTDASSAGAESHEAESPDSDSQHGGRAEASVADAFCAVGKAAEAAKSSGLADALCAVGKAAAQTAKTTGHAAADAVKSAKADHDARQRERRREAENAARGAVPEPNDDFRTSFSESHAAQMPNQTCPPVGSGKDFSFKDIKDLNVNINFGRLFGAIVADVLLWSWLLGTLASIAIGMCFGAIPIFGEGFTAFFSSSYVGYHVISRIFLGMGLVLLAIIVLMLGILLIRGIIKLVKHIVMIHVKAIYNL